MSAGKGHGRRLQPATRFRRKKRIGVTPASPKQPPTAKEAFLKCLEAIQLVEVVRRALDNPECAQERTTLKYALQPLWFVHDFVQTLDRDSDEEKDEEEDN